MLTGLVRRIGTGVSKENDSADDIVLEYQDDVVVEDNENTPSNANYYTLSQLRQLDIKPPTDVVKGLIQQVKQCWLLGGQRSVRVGRLIN